MYKVHFFVKYVRSVHSQHYSITEILHKPAACHGFLWQLVVGPRPPLADVVGL